MQLVLATGGAYVGGSIGGPIGAQLGWALGSYLGGLASQKDLPIQEGPRVSDLKAPQSASPGLMVTILFGTMRLPVQMIWGPDKVQHEVITTVESEGAKGSPPEQQQRTFYATADAAYGVCEGPIEGFRKWWTNSKLVEDKSDDSPVASRFGGVFSVFDGVTLPTAIDTFLNVVTVYPGSTTQPQDPTIANLEGGANTPAYRDTAYFVFNDLDLSPYFQNHPQVEVETVKAGTHSVLVPEVFYTYAGELTARGGDATESRRNTPGATAYWAVLEDGSGDPRHLALFDNYTHQQLVSQLETGNIWLASENGLNGRVWYDVEGDQIKAISTTGQVWEWGNLLASYDFIVQIYEFPVTDDPDLADQENFPEIFLQKVNVGPGSISILHGNASAMLELDTVVTGHGVNQFFDSADRIAGRVYVFCSTFGGTPNSHIGYASTGAGNTFTVVRTYDSAADCPGMVGRDGYLYVKSANTGFFNVIEKLDADGGVVDSITLPGILTTNQDEVRMVQDVAGTLYVQLDQEIFRIHSGTMTLDAQASLPNETWIMPTDGFEGRGILVVRDDTGHRDKLYIIGPDTISPDSQPLSDVSAEIFSMRGGYDPSKYNVSLLTSIPVRGYAIRRRTSRRNMLAPLFDANFVDMVESDGVLKCVPRGSASVITIPESDLGAHTGERDDPVDTLRITRREELDYRNPVEVTVLYIRKESDYQVGMQNSRRLPTPSKHAVTIEYPIVFTDDEAKQIADKKAFSMEYERETYEFSTGRKYAYLEPTDVITVIKGGVAHIMRLVDKKEGGNGVFDWVGVADLSSLQSQLSVGVVPSAMAPQVIKLVGPTVPEFLDVPLLRDQDDNGGFIWGARGTADGWLGAQLYQSLDEGATYTAIGPVATAASLGYTLNALGDYDESLVEFIDEGNYIDVLMLSGSTPASITRAQLLEGGNPIVVGGEPMQYRDADLIAANTYRLTGLLRGRRGSESYMGTHVVGERVVLLDARLRSLDLPTSQIGQRLYYKAVSLGRTLAQTSPTTFLNTGRRKKPLAPVHLGGGKNAAGDWVFDWTRRTRYVAPFVPGFNVPLGEATERYLAEMIVDSAVVYSVEVTAPTATYPAADQTLEFGGQIGAVTLRVSLISDEVGAGQSAERAFTDFRYHRYWRLTTLNITDATFEISEIQFLSGGVNITSQGTYSSSIAPNVVTTLGELFDGSLITRTIWTAAQAEDPSFWIKIDFGLTPKTVDGIKQAGYDTTGRHMTGFTLEWSDDNSLWTALGSKAGLSYPGNNTLSALYTIP